MLDMLELKNFTAKEVLMDDAENDQLNVVKSGTHMAQQLPEIERRIL